MAEEGTAEGGVEGAAEGGGGAAEGGVEGVAEGGGRRPMEAGGAARRRAARVAVWPVEEAAAEGVEGVRGGGRRRGGGRGGRPSTAGVARCGGRPRRRRRWHGGEK